MASVHDLSSHSSYVPITPLPLPGSVDNVKLIDAPSVTASRAQPTLQDVLNAVNDLAKSISQLSKNQQIIEKNVEAMQKRIYHSTINGMNSGISRIYQQVYTTEIAVESINRKLGS